MEFHRPRRFRPTVDMTPMIDCVFQLLVFFLLTSTFRPPAVDLNLPSGRVSTPPKEDGITVELDDRNQIWLNSDRVVLDNLAREIGKASAGVDDPVVTLRADGGLDYDWIMKVVFAIREGGVERLQLAYEPEDAP